MPDNLNFDLTFPQVAFGERETPWNLKRWLYSGGASIRADLVVAAITSGSLSQPLLERVEMVQSIHDVLSGWLARGGSKYSVRTAITTLNAFFQWVDSNYQSLRFESLQPAYLEWAESLRHRALVTRTLKANTAYHMAGIVGNVFTTVLGRDRSLILLTRLRYPTQRKSAKGIQADKQNLEETFRFGHLLSDICDGLSLENLWGSLPVTIQLQQGGSLKLWSLLPEINKRRKEKGPDYKPKQRDLIASLEARAAWEADRTLRTRFPVANLRIEAELMMFIGQTGMNLTQAHQLTLRHFSFNSSADSYQVRDYKARAGGEVLFVIYKKYKNHFLRYLQWRKTVFPDEELLFPLVRQGRALDKAPLFGNLKNACTQTQVIWVTPSKLRNTRVNWLLRRSGDTDQTTEFAQHTKQVLLGTYEQPSQQRAISEITRFWGQIDTNFVATKQTDSVAPGQCSGMPSPVLACGDSMVPPDCTYASGCLWCEHHRDIDASDYVWALASFRHLKTIELAKYRSFKGQKNLYPAELVIDRLSKKLEWYKGSNFQRRSWVEEAEARVKEGHHHPDWMPLINGIAGA